MPRACEEILKAMEKRRGKKQNEIRRDEERNVEERGGEGKVDRGDKMMKK